MDLGWRARFGRMAKIAVFHRPGNFIVMASTAVLPVDNLEHVDFITTCLEFKTQVGMTDFAAKSDSMKPVRKNHGTHLGRVRIIIHHDIAIFRMHQRAGRHADDHYDGA